MDIGIADLYPLKTTGYLTTKAGLIQNHCPAQLKTKLI